MTSYTFDANIVIDALAGSPLARAELLRAGEVGQRPWISRVAWVDVLSKGLPHELKAAELFLSGFSVDEFDLQTAQRAAALRRERPKLKSPDAIILASAQIHGRILVTRNTKDFPANMPGIRVPYTL